SKFLMIVAALWAFGLTFMILADVTGRGAVEAPHNRSTAMGCAANGLKGLLPAGAAQRPPSIVS
ncbi:MAG: hypothetical protein VW453_14755, partial [Rhodospirillaceae bacterium]